MDLVIQLLRTQAEEILHTESVTQESKTQRLMTFTNPSGGASVEITEEAGQDLRVKLYNTPRYYPRDAFGIKRLQEDLEKYSRGESAVLTYTDRTGAESDIDRVAPVAGTEALTLNTLVDLCMQINLIHSDALKDLLAAGGWITFRFWDQTKNFRYRQLGDKLNKEPLA